METLIATLIAALLTGLTILAYRHPEGYKKIYSWIAFSLMVVVISVTALNAGITTGFSSVASYIELGRFDLAAKASDTMRFPQIYIWAMILANLYLLGLVYLHSILKGEQQSALEK